MSEKEPKPLREPIFYKNEKHSNGILWSKWQTFETGSILSLVDRAKEFATLAHASVGQTRKYSGEPYIMHPASVVKILESTPEIKENIKYYDEMIASAWLHDTVEDTETSYSDIYKEFGKMVATFVFYLTDIRKEMGNREVRHFLYRQMFANAPIECKYIKLADSIHNLSDIKIQDINFFRVYRKEKLLMLAECFGENYDFCGLLPKVKSILEE